VRSCVTRPGRGPQGHERDHEDAWSCHGWAPRTSARARRGPGRPPREALGDRGNRASPHAASAELNAVLGCPEPGRRGRRHQQPDGPPQVGGPGNRCANRRLATTKGAAPVLNDTAMPGTQVALRASKVPFRAPARKAVHSEWVNDNTDPAGSLELRTSTDWPANATSTQSPLPHNSLLRHSMLDRPGSAMRPPPLRPITARGGLPTAVECICPEQPCGVAQGGGAAIARRSGLGW